MIEGKVKSQNKPKGISVIVKATNDCNFSCSYCYVGEAKEKWTMDESTLENTIKKIVEYNGKEGITHFIWHGGEPLLMGLEFFKKITGIEKSLAEEYTITNGVQSNGTLLTEELADFFAENQFRVGLSLDGMQKSHDETRPYKIETNGSHSSFEDVLRSVKLAKQKMIGGGVICVVTQKNIDHLDEIYKFFKEESINPKFNHIIAEGKAKRDYDYFSITPLQYGKAMVRLFDMWFSDHTSKIDINPFDLIIGNLMGGGVPRGCNYLSSCQDNFISVGVRGDVYPCGRFDGNSDFCLGNINTDSMKEIDMSPVRTRMRERTQNIKECDPCSHYKICNSGCPHDAYVLTGDINNKTPFCAGYKLLFDHIGKAIIKELKQAEVLENGKMRC